MYVTVTTVGENDQPQVTVMGEVLVCQNEGHYLLPGRYVHALKTDDLPVGIGFALSGALPSGYGFYQEDQVIFSRKDGSSTLQVEVTSTYKKQEWDGLFPLDATLLSRKEMLEKHEHFSAIRYDIDDEKAEIGFAFTYPAASNSDLEQVMESVCDTVFEVEAQGNLQLWRLNSGHIQEW
ncbi:hypothetical protein [Brevibacillus invocatus]|uniref:hypothetical protein n=1 Tax=Brevibacillus invocatus TaxID=173959 RepID=UPI00203D5A46|nr:hypothetical protein [Brevibacillus invocatus]MCM3077788.1 hypothetical protein [Brevibacillus invocatus]MCM3428138.1 hypothetical protein [Brevibacillus invocatus]